MSPMSIVVQQPQSPASSLILLMHGVGAAPQSKLRTAHWFANRNSTAMVVSVASPEPSDVSNGRQWFSVKGVTEDNRQARVDAAMPTFLATVRHWQGVSRTDAQRTLVAGFSQGAIMALESTKLEATAALRIVAIAGRFASLPNHQSGATIHILHGDSDR